MRTYKKKRYWAGFTLIELMIVVAVIAILAAVAYPSYAEYLRKSRRAEAQSVLMDIATRQQQLLLDTRAYADAQNDADLASKLGVSISSTVSANYTVTSTAPTPTALAPVPSFTLTAAPRGAQIKDTCGTLTLTNTGAKTPSKCW
jgi:type IV pilus assembly protein PilE